MKLLDTSPTTIPQLLDLVDTFPLSSQLDLIEFLLRRISPQTVDLDPATDAAWKRIAELVSHHQNAIASTAFGLRRGRSPATPTVRSLDVRSRSRSTGTGRDMSPVSVCDETLMYTEMKGMTGLLVPEEIRPVLEVLRNLEKAEAGEMFHGSASTPALSHANLNKKSGTKVMGPSPSLLSKPFEAIEYYLLTILIHTPHLLLRPISPTESRSRSSSSKGRRSQSTDRSALNAKSVLSHVLSASRDLASTIEYLVSMHNETILEGCKAQKDVEAYQGVCEGLWEATRGVIAGVKRVKRGEGGSAVYGAVVKCAMLFVEALENFVTFAVAVIKLRSAVAAPSGAENATGGTNMTTTSPGVTVPVRIDSAISFTAPSVLDQTSTYLQAPTPQRTTSQSSYQSSQNSPHRPATPTMDSPQRPGSNSSFTARIRHRLTQLTDRRISVGSTHSHSSVSSSSSEEGSLPTRVSQTSHQSDAEPSGNGNIGKRRGKSVDIPRKAGTYKVERTSLDALRPTTGTSPRIGRKATKKSESGLRRSFSATRDRDEEDAVDGVKRETNESEGQMIKHITHDTVPLLPDLSFEAKTGVGVEWLTDVFNLSDTQPLMAVSPAVAEAASRHKHAHRGHARNLSSSSLLSVQSLTSVHSATLLPMNEEWRVRVPTDIKENEAPYAYDVKRWSTNLSLNGLPTSPTRKGTEATGDSPKTLTDSGTVKPEADTVMFESLRTLRMNPGSIPTFDSQGVQIGVLEGGRFTTTPTAAFSATRTTFAVAGPQQTGTVSNATPSEHISIHGNHLHLHLSSQSHPDSDSRPSSQTVLIMELTPTTGKLHIVAGTLEKLVTRLADENGWDNEFVDDFVRCCGFWMGSAALWRCLMARWDVDVGASEEQPQKEDLGAAVGEGTSVGESPRQHHELRHVIKRKVLAVIARWVRLRIHDFSNTSDLHEELVAFLAAAESEGYATDVLRIRRGFVTACLKHARRAKAAMIAWKGYGGSVCPFPIKEGDALCEDTPLLALDARDVARYLTVVDVRLMRSISVEDYIDKLNKSHHLNKSVKDVGGSGSGSGSDQLDSVDILISRANLLRNYLILELCTLTSKKARRRLLEKLVDVAFHLLALRNLHSCFFVVSALQSVAVARLKRTWEGVKGEARERWKRVESAMDVGGNMKGMREALKFAEGAGGGAVPCLAVVLKDGTFVVEGNRDWVDVEHQEMESPSSDNMVTDTKTDAVPADSTTDTETSTPTATTTTTTECVNTSDSAHSVTRLINFDKYRTLTRILSRYISHVEAYTFPSLASTSASSSSSASVSDGGFSIPFDSSSFYGLDHVRAVVESRMRWSDDERYEGDVGKWAWECAGRCGGEEE
ncbi:ras guanine nucleotide exchange factor domain-containing protein [Gaertneriomyces semiglobifer]|nr:ras guanine nucleotide exchange factor domain-containing protein [Gaertneriomyces semiglobifer]